MTTPQRETTLQIVERLAPRQILESNNVKNHYRMLCPVCNYESRGGRFTIFAIHQDQNQWKCFACGEGGGPKEMLGHLSGFAPIEYSAPNISGPSRRTREGELVFQGAQLDPFCAAKGLDPAWVATELGWRNGTWRHWDSQKRRYIKVPAVEIPYYTLDKAGNRVESQTRYRVGIDTGERMRSRGSQILYGLWNLPFIFQKGWVIIVEGETDFAALYSHNYPVIGVPGASFWRKEFAQLLEGVQIFLWAEPDQGGDTLTKKVIGTTKNVRIINAPPEAKDPNELAHLLGDRNE